MTGTEENKRKLYNVLVGDGYTPANIGDYDTFSKNLNDSANVTKLYQTLIGEGYSPENIGSESDFVSRLWRTQDGMNSGLIDFSGRQLIGAKNKKPTDVDFSGVKVFGQHLQNKPLESQDTVVSGDQALRKAFEYVSKASSFESPFSAQEQSKIRQDGIVDPDVTGVSKKPTSRNERVQSADELSKYVYFLDDQKREELKKHIESSKLQPIVKENYLFQLRNTPFIERGGLGEAELAKIRGEIKTDNLKDIGSRFIESASNSLDNSLLGALKVFGDDTANQIADRLINTYLGDAIPTQSHKDMIKQSMGIKEDLTGEISSVVGNTAPIVGEMFLSTAALRSSGITVPLEKLAENSSRVSRMITGLKTPLQGALEYVTQDAVFRGGKESDTQAVTGAVENSAEALTTKMLTNSLLRKIKTTNGLSNRVLFGSIKGFGGGFGEWAGEVGGQLATGQAQVGDLSDPRFWILTGIPSFMLSGAHAFGTEAARRTFIDEQVKRGAQMGLYTDAEVPIITEAYVKATDPKEAQAIIEQTGNDIKSLADAIETATNNSDVPENKTFLEQLDVVVKGAETIEEEIQNTEKLKIAAENVTEKTTGDQNESKQDQTTQEEITQVEQGPPSDVESQTGETMGQAPNISPSDQIKVIDVPMKDIETDVESFQGRENAFVESHVQNIVKNFDPAKMTPVNVWRNPKTGKWNILSGHNRHESYRRMGQETIPAIEFVGNYEQAKEFALTSNLQNLAQSDIENARLYKQMRESGKLSQGELKNETEKLFKNNRTYIEALSYLNPKGKVVDQLRTMENTTSQDKRVVQQIAQWVGEARKHSPELTDSHEREMFDYLRGGALKNIGNKIIFLDRIAKKVSDFSFNPSQPLNLISAISKSPIESQYDDMIAEAETKLKEVNTEIAKQYKDYSDRGATPQDLDRILSGLRSERDALESELLALKNKKSDIRQSVKDEIDLFGQLNEEVANGTITQAEVDAAYEGTENPSGATIGNSEEAKGRSEDQETTGNLAALNVPRLLNRNQKTIDDYKNKSAQDLVRRLSEIYNIPIRIGKYRAQALGLFKRGPETIRVGQADDFQTIAHELGHSLSKKFGFQFNKSTQMRTPEHILPFRSELIALGEATSRQSYSKAKKTEEGIAEFYRLLLTDQEQVVERAPQFYNFFISNLAKYPQMQAAHNEAKIIYNTLLAKTDEEIIHAMIDWDGSRDQLAKESGGGALERFYTKHIDDLRPLERMVSGVYDGKQPAINAYTLLRLTRGSQAKSLSMFKNGIVTSDGTKIADGIADTFEEIEKSKLSQKFQDYLVARRIYLDKKTFSEERYLAARNFLRDIENDPSLSKFKDWEERFDEFTNGLLELAQYEGLITPEEYFYIKQKNMHWVHFVRVMEDAVYKGTGGKGEKGPIAKFSGKNEAMIWPPFEALIKYTDQMAYSVMRQKVNESVYEMTQLEGKGKFVEILDTPPMQPINISMEKLTSALEQKEHMITPIWEDKETQAIGPILQLWDKPGKYSLDEPIISVVVDGKRKFVRVNDATTWHVLNSTHPDLANVHIGILKSAARILSQSATSTISFTVRNPLFDIGTAMLQSKNNFTPLDFMRGLKSIIKRDQYFKAFNESGAAQSSFYINRFDYKNQVAQLSQDTKTKIAKEVLTSPFELMRVTALTLENATRIGEFRKAYKNAQQKGMTEKNARAYAAYSAREVTTDFQRGGQASLNHNAYVAFYNATVQGVDRVIRTTSDNPKKTMALLGATVALPSLVLAYLNMDDDEIKNRPDWEKRMFMMWRDPVTGSVIRVPRPRTWGWVGYKIEQVWQQEMSGKTEYGKSLLNDLQTVGDDVLKMYIPTAMIPMVEVSADYSFFRDRSIVGEWQKNLPTELQYNEYTSETAKSMSLAMPQSVRLAPAQIDHLIQGYTAGLGRAAVQYGTDNVIRFLSNKQERAGIDRPMAEKIPVINAFISSNPYSNAQNIKDYLEEQKRISGLKQVVNKYKEQTRRRGNVSYSALADDLKDNQEFAAIYNENIDAFQNIDLMDRYSKQTDDVWKQIREIYKSNELTAVEKREKVDELYTQLTYLINSYQTEKQTSQ